MLVSTVKLQLRQFLLQPSCDSVFFFPAFSSADCVSWPFVQAFLSTAEVTSGSFDFPSLRIFGVCGLELLLHLYISEAGNQRFISPSALFFCCCCSVHRACVYSNFIFAWRNVETRSLKASCKIQVAVVNSQIVHVCKNCKMWLGVY